MGYFTQVALPLYMPTALQLIRRTEGWVVFYGFRIGGLHKTIVFNYILQSTTIGHRPPCYSLISFSLRFIHFRVRECKKTEHSRWVVCRREKRICKDFSTLLLLCKGSLVRRDHFRWSRGGSIMGAPVSMTRTRWAGSPGNAPAISGQVGRIRHVAHSKVI